MSQSRSEVLGLLARRNVAPLRRLGGCCAAGAGKGRGLVSQSRSEILGLLSRHNVTPLRRLGQHFLADGNLVRKAAGLLGFPLGLAAAGVGAGLVGGEPVGGFGFVGPA